LIKGLKILALIPARGGSKEIKNKNLLKIKGKSLIELASKFIDECKFFDEKFISTDSDSIKNEGKKFNLKIIHRPKILSGDRISDFSVILHSLKYIKKQKLNYDYLVYLQPTSPNRNINHLKRALKLVIKLKLDGAWSVDRINVKFHPLKILTLSKKKYLKLFDQRGKKIIARQQLNKNIFIRNGAFYIFRIKSFLKSKSLYLKKIVPSVSSLTYANIDSLQDFKKASLIN